MAGSKIRGYAREEGGNSGERIIVKSGSCSVLNHALDNCGSYRIT